MSVTNPTTDDRLRWICNTSAEEGQAEIKRLLTNPDIPNEELRDLFESAMAYEIHGAHRKSLINSLRTALKKFTPTATPVEVLAPETVKSLDQGKLIEAINANHAAAQADAALAAAAGKSAVCRAIVAGLQLIQLRDATAHGQWESLFASGLKRIGKANATHESHLELDSRTALRYMAVATQLVTKKLQPEQSQALMALATGAEADEAAQHLLDEITPPKSLRQTYLELGIVKPTPKEAAWLSAEPAADPAGEKPSATSKLLSAKDSARCDWFGTHKVGRVEPGSIVGMVLTELADPAKGSARLLSKADLESMSHDFARMAKYTAELAKEK